MSENKFVCSKIAHKDWITSYIYPMNIDDYIEQSNHKIIKDFKSIDMVDPITKIKDELYLGQGRTTAYAEILSKIGITHIVSIGQSPHQATVFGPFFKLELQNALDNENEDLAVHFPTIFEFMRRAIKDGGKIYVHCAMGISRSSTIVIAFLRANGYFNSLQEAYDYVKRKRPWINPNAGFKKQLQSFFLEKLG